MMRLTLRHLKIVLLAAFAFPLILSAQDTKSKPEKSLDLTHLADDAGKKGNIHEAEVLYLQAVDLDTKNGKAWRGLAKITREKGDLNKAISFLKEGWSNGDSGSLKELGVIFIQTGKYKEFEPWLPDFLKLKDSDIEARSLLVAYNLKSGKIDRDLLEQTLSGLDFNQLNGQTDESLKLLILGYETLGQTQNAEKVRAFLKSRPLS